MGWRHITTKLILLASFFLCAGNGYAQSVEKEPAAVVELGGAGSWNIKNGGSAFGPTAAVEVTPIENWLELRRESRRFSAVTRPNGISTCYSRSLGHSRKKRSSCWALDRSGFTPQNTA